MWKPIDEAPRDGACVLVASVLAPYPPFVEIGKWDVADEEAPKWVSWYGTRIVQPFAFMPLPTPPEAP